MLYVTMDRDVRLAEPLTTRDGVMPQETAPRTGAERTAASRERTRKAEGYDQAVAEAEQAKLDRDAAVEEAVRLREQLTEFQRQQSQWVQDAQAAIADRDGTISLQGQQLAQLRQQLAPLAIAPPPVVQPDNYFVVRCPRCQGPVHVPRGNNHVTARN